MLENNDECQEQEYGKHDDLESRVGALEISRATSRVKIEQINDELESGKEKFDDIYEKVQKHEIEIVVLKEMREDIRLIKDCVQKIKGEEQERKGVWKVLIGISVGVGILIQALASYFTHGH